MADPRPVYRQAVYQRARESLRSVEASLAALPAGRSAVPRSVHMFTAKDSTLQGVDQQPAMVEQTPVQSVDEAPAMVEQLLDHVARLQRALAEARGITSSEVLLPCILPDVRINSPWLLPVKQALEGLANRALYEPRYITPLLHHYDTLMAQLEVRNDTSSSWTRP